RCVSELLAQPDFTLYFALSDSHGYGDSCILQERVSVHGIGIHRSPIRPDDLVRVSLLPLNADAHDREAVVLCALEVVARQNAKTTSVRFEIVLKGILHTEVCHTGKGFRGHSYTCDIRLIISAMTVGKAA